MVARIYRAFLSIITGGGKYICLEVTTDAADQTLLLDAERKFWFCVQDGSEPLLVNAAAPSATVVPVKIIDMRKSNAWAMAAGDYLETKSGADLHAAAKEMLKKLIPDDAKEARGHGVRGKRNKAGAVTFEQWIEEEIEDVA